MLDAGKHIPMFMDGMPSMALLDPLYVALHSYVLSGNLLYFDNH